MRKATEPSVQQEQVYDILVTLHLQTGIPPSLDELAGRLLLTKPTIARHLKSLERFRRVERKGTARRGWKSTNPLHTPNGLVSALAQRLGQVQPYGYWRIRGSLSQPERAALKRVTQS